MTAKADSISNSGGSRVEVQSIHVTEVSSCYPVYIRPNDVKLDRRGVLKMKTEMERFTFASEHYPCQSTFGRIILS
jgi:hypothetical protein